MNLILLSTLESIVESRTRLRADRAGAMILHHTFFLGTGFTFTSISPPVQSAQAAPHQADQKIGRSWMLATGLEGLKFVPQKWGTFMFVPQVPQMGYKWGTQKGPHTFFRRFGYYALYALWWPLTTSSDLKWPLVTSKGQLHPKPIWIQHTYL